MSDEADKLFKEGIRVAQVEKNLLKAHQLWAKSCALGNPQSCFQQGISELDGSLGSPNYNEAQKLFLLACEGKSKPYFPACFNYAFMHEEAQDYSTALKYYDMVCKQESFSRGTACNNLARMHEKGLGTAVDLTQAYQMYRRACDLRQPDACQSVGAALLHGHGTKRDPEAAVRHFEQLCAGGAGQACFSVGVCALKGDGMAQDTKKAMALMQQGCQLGYQKSCMGLQQLARSQAAAAAAKKQ